MGSSRREALRAGLLAAGVASALPAGGGRAVAAPLPAPVLSCQADARVLDWDQNAWTSRSLSESYAVDGTPLAFTVSGDTRFFQTLNTQPPYSSPETNDLLGGGYAPRQQTVFLFVNNDTTARQVQVRMQVGEPGVGVAAVQVPFFDVDVTGANTPYGFQDRLRAQGFLNGGAVAPTGRTTSLYNEPSGTDTIVGRDGGAPSNGAGAEDGTAIFTFDAPVDEVVFTYGSGPQTQANPAQQGIGVHDVTFCQLIDRADAPASYGAPTHLVRAGVFIGTALPDHEPAARHSADARGDEDEGGESETDWPDLYPDEVMSLSVPVSGTDGRLSAWVDWDGDGVFGADERVAADERDADGNGEVTLSVAVPENAPLGQTYARLRWTTEAGVGPTGAAPDGEVEDVRVAITPPPSTGGPATPLPPLSCPAREERLDWDDPAYAWPRGADAQGYTVGATAFSMSRSYSDGRASDGRPETWPRTGIGKTGGLQPEEATLRLGPDMPNDAHSTTMRIDVGEPGVGVDGLQFEVFDVDASPAGPGQARERLRAVGYLNGAPVAPPIVTTNARTVDEGGGTAGGTAPTASDSADGTVGFTFAGRVDRIDLVYGGRDEGEASIRQSVGLHDLRYCAPRDFGDAPRGYEGASHRITPGLHVGPAAPDADAGMRRSANADGDDAAGADDETDGLFGTLIAGETVTIDVPVTEPSPGAARLQAWIDWDADGSFSQTGDRVAADRRDRNADGTVTLTVTVPATAAPGASVARLRWSSRSNLHATGDAPDGEVEDHAVTIAAGGVRRVTGRVLIDDGRGGGTAHDGEANGAETGRPGQAVLVRAADGSLLATLRTDGSGKFSYAVPDTQAGEVLTFEAAPGTGFAAVSEDRSDGDDGAPRDGVLTVAAPPSGTVSVLFGQVPAPTLTAGRTRQVEPGGVATFTHRYAPGTAGSAAFALGDPAGPAAPEFSGSLFIDADCDGRVGAAEGRPPASLAVTAAAEVCLIVRVAADPSAQEGARASLPVSAVLTRARGAGTASVANDDQVTVARDGGATLTKEVCNADRASCDLATGAGFTAQNGGAPGERLVYRIVFTAAGANPVRGVTITDQTPLYSSLVGETVRVSAAPPALSCTVTPASGAQADGYTGPIEWRCAGDLQPGSEGIAAFEVRIDP